MNHPEGINLKILITEKEHIIEHNNTQNDIKHCLEVKSMI